MKKWSLKRQIQCMVLLPSFFACLVLTVYFNSQFLKTKQLELQHQGMTIIRQLLPMSEYALGKENQALLSGIINTALTNPGIRSIAFLDKNKRLIAYHPAGEISINAAHLPETDQISIDSLAPHTLQFIVRVPALQNRLYLSRSHDPLSMNLHSLPNSGWLVLNLDTKNIQFQIYHSLIISLLAGVICFFISMMIGLRLIRKIYEPIQCLKTNLQKIEEHDYQLPLLVSENADIGEIETIIRKLLEVLKAKDHDLQAGIELANRDLQQNLLALEEKIVQLDLARKDALEKSRIKSEFIANMSHEIRTPMNGLIGFAKLLNETALSPLQKDYLGTIQKSGQNLLSIINDILDLSKIEAGKLELDIMPFDLRHCIDEVITLLAPEAQKKSLQLIAIIAENCPEKILADPLRIKQVLTNLIANAIKFTDSGSVTLRTYLKSWHTESVDIGFEVIDTGIGLSQADQAALFKVFSQANVAIKRKFGGTGLGLVISDRLIQAMGGNLQLNSSPGQGSCFAFFIQANIIGARPAESSGAPFFKKITAGIFSSDALHTEAWASMFDFFKLDYQTLSSLDELASFCQKEKPDFILFDFSLPETRQLDLSELQEKILPLTPQQIVFAIPGFTRINYTDLDSYGFKNSIPYPLSYEKCQQLLLDILKQEPQTLDDKNTSSQRLAPTLKTKAKLLIADDNSINLLLFDATLTKYGIEIVSVENGIQALQKARTEHYDLIILDIQMPQMDGIEAGKIIRSHSGLNKNTPLLAVSAVISKQDQIALIEAGFNDWLQKPIQESILIQKMTQFIPLDLPAPLDWNRSVGLMNNNPQLARDYLNKFVKELKKIYPEIKALSLPKAKTHLEDITHKLLGACAFCEVLPLRKCCERILDSLKKSSSEEIESFREQLLQEIENVIEVYMQKFYDTSVLIAGNEES